LPDQRKNTGWLLLLCGCQLFIMLVFINYSAILPLLKTEWGMNNTQAGVIFSVYQLGYISSGVLLSTLSDRLNIRNIFVTAALWSGIANLLFGLFAHDFTSGLLLRGLTGIGMGGTYMPGLKLVAERFESHQRGRAIGIYVGSLVLGASLSLVVPGIIAARWGWRSAMVVCSLGVFLGAGLSLTVFRGYRPAPLERSVKGFSGEIVANRPALLIILGYASHMWEMYGMRSWLAPFFAAALTGWGVATNTATATAAFIAALLVGIGAFSTVITGSLSDRFGRTTTISLVMLASAGCSFLFGWLINTNLWLTLAVGILYGWLVVAESPVFSTGLTELVAPGYLGAAMGIQSLIGYTMGMISPTVFGWALDRFQDWQPWPGVNGAWGVAFTTVGLGALCGPVCMWLLRRHPESSRMARGKR
jgi:MFS family permease